MKKARDLFSTIRISSVSRHGRTATSQTQMDPSERYCYKPTLSWNPQVEEYFVKAYGADHFSRISQALTCPSCYSCIRVNILKSTSDAVIEKLLAILQERVSQNALHSTYISKSNVNASILDKKQIHNLKESNIPLNWVECNEAPLKFSESVEFPKVLSQTGSIFRCQLPGLDYVFFIKGSGPHNIEYEFREDRPPKEVVVSRKCAEAVLRGAQVYVPGVLACSSHIEKGDVVAVSVAVEQPVSDSGWGIGITRGTVLQGLPTDPHYFERNGLYIGQGTSMMSRAGIFREPEGVAVDMNNRVFKLPSFHGLLEGEIFLQNLPSIITAHALDPQQGERILDMCAAPGGKTTAIAILMRDIGEVVAVDRSHNKVLDVKKLAAEMGLNCITTYKLDALKSVRQSSELHDMTTLHCSETNQHSDSLTLKMENIPSVDIEVIKEEENGIYTSKAEPSNNIWRMKNGPGRNHSSGVRVEKSKGFSPNSFDRVLLDAPCSALGLRPRLFAGEETVQSLRNHAKYQRRMFDQAVQLVRPGGVLVYSTCTINPGENEALVRYALDKYKFLSLSSQHPRIGGPGLVGSCEFSDGYVEEWLRPGEEDLVQRFDPSAPPDTIGFFIAKFDVGPKDA